MHQSPIYHTINTTRWQNDSGFQLHAHLSGSITRECLHEIWTLKKAKDPGLQIENPLVLMPLGKVNYDLQT